jgi:hypothetical protein
MLTSNEHDRARHFRLLERTTNLIAHHSTFPGKDEAVKRCREDIEQRYRLGMLTVEQRDRLLAILDDEEPA